MDRNATGKTPQAEHARRTTLIFMLALLVIGAVLLIAGGLLMLYGGTVGWGVAQLALALLALALVLVVAVQLKSSR